MKIEGSEKADRCWELNPGHLACAASGLLLSYMTLRQPPALTISSMYCSGGTDMPFLYFCITTSLLQNETRILTGAYELP